MKDTTQAGGSINKVVLHVMRLPFTYIIPVPGGGKKRGVLEALILNLRMEKKAFSYRIIFGSKIPVYELDEIKF